MNAAALCGLDERTKVSITGEQCYMIDISHYFKHVDGKLDDERFT
jgi:hypothetical protein